MSNPHILIVGGGSAGITTAAHLLNARNDLNVTIIEPSEKHYYQPLWTLVGGGVFPKEESERDQADFMPTGANWLKDSVASFAPENNEITTAGGESIGYDYLVVCPGLQLNWTAIKGLSKDIVGQHGICSNYSYDTVESTWKEIQNFKSGTALFTHPDTPIKCGGAPQKICYLAEDHFSKSGIRNDAKVVFATAKPRIFPVEPYATSLERIIERKQIDLRLEHNLKEVRPDKKEAVFDQLSSGEEIVIQYDMLHVTPKMGACDFVKNSPLAGEDGWITVDPRTTQHVKYPNVFSLGDSSNLPTSKTGAAIRKQAPTTAENILCLVDQKPMSGNYNGYTSCPLVTGYNSLILAEFDYDKNPEESFPFDQSKERFSMYMLKKHGLPKLYWHGMLRGRA